MTAPSPGPGTPAIARAAELLRAGGLVAFPTETVYGLGADALDEDAVRRIFAAKGRPADNPLIVHLADASQLSMVARDVGPLARTLAARHWPGPLTLVLDAAPAVPEVTRAGLTTVAVRVPDHPVALELLRTARVAVAAPSANRSGRPSPTTAAHVRDDLGDAVDLVVDGGPCRLGVESTVVDARGEEPVVLREGMVTREQLGVGEDRRPPPTEETGASPGTRHRHYQPDCAVVVVGAGEGSRVASRLVGEGRHVGLVSTSPAPGGVVPVARVGSPGELAAALYASLREADRVGLDVLVVESVDDQGVGRAVMDRLRRAAQP